MLVTGCCYRLLYRDNFAQFWFQVCLLGSQIPPLLAISNENPTGIMLSLALECLSVVWPIFNEANLDLICMLYQYS